IENVSVVLAETFFRLFLDGQHLPAGAVDCRSEALEFPVDICRRDPPLIDTLRTVVHPQHLTDHNPFGNSQALETNFRSWLRHSEDSVSMSPRPSANNRSIAAIAASSSTPSALAISSVPRLA